MLLALMQFGEEEAKHILRAHWVEEAQHARIDVLLVDQLAASLGDADRLAAVEAYLRVVDRLDAAFATHVELDIEAFGGVDGRLRDRWRAAQRPAYRDASLLAGLNHPRFRSVADALHPDAQAALDAASTRLSGDG